MTRPRSSRRLRYGLTAATTLVAVAAASPVDAKLADTRSAAPTTVSVGARAQPPGDAPAPDLLSLLRRQKSGRDAPGNGRRTEAEPYSWTPYRQAAAPGALDPTFGTRGVTSTRIPGREDAANDLVVLRDGAIVAAGGDVNYESPDLVLVRHRCDGTLDTTFGDQGRVVTPVPPFDGGGGARAVTADRKGRIVVASITGLGAEGEYGFLLARYLPNGRLDRTFGADGLVVTPVGPLRRSGADDVLVLPDGRILAAGGANDAEGRPSFAAARYLPDGRLDASFGNDGTVLVPMPGGDAAASRLVVQKDGRIVLGGTAVEQGLSRFALVRLTPDGALDPSFGGDGVVIEGFPDSAANGINDLAIQPDGRIVAAGVTGDPNDRTDFALMRFRPDGSLDPAFGGDGRVRTDFGSNAGATGVVLSPRGGAVAVGQAWPNTALAGYLPNGELDENFGIDGRTVTSIGPLSAASAAGLQFGRRIVVAGLTNDGSPTDAAFMVARYGLLDGHFPKHCGRAPSVNGRG
ncbi:hypothetical protein ACIBCR_03300 [Micromonospora echinospora]|uniref:hypothetical protein n=1 Tax=Micromonospora echinospora TaxID=1877 RepID=UPI0037A736EC